MTRMDAQGRVLIPQHLRAKASMRGEVVVVGYPDHLDVWNPQSFVEHMELDPITKEDQQELADSGI
jgi:DNA-binding transcriptional regulator/RsmH inhibitor MraZ